MGFVTASKHISHLLVIALLIFATCSAHKGKSSKGRSSSYKDGYYNNRYGGRRGNIPGLNNCYARGAYPCYGIANNVHCYNPYDRCNGRHDCPMGDDEMQCQKKSDAERTVFSVRTSTRTTTSTTTTTTTTTTSVTSTVSSTMTSTTSVFMKMSAIVVFKATSSATTVLSTVTKTYTGLLSVSSGSTFSSNVIVCSNLQAAVGNVAPTTGQIYTYAPVSWSFFLTPTAHVSCMPSTTIFST